MRPLHERDQATVAVVGTIVIALVVLMAMNLNRVPFLHPKSQYVAQFASADGLRSGSDVRVAGITVGSVTSVRVDGGRVEVRFTVRKGLRLGDRSAASIEIATVLGQLFLQVTSAGSGTLRPGDTIPLARTSVPYTLLDALGTLGSNTAKTNLPQLQTAFDQLAATLQGVRPKDVHAILSGFATLAGTVASRQDEIANLLDQARRITSTLNDHADDFIALVADGDAVLQLLERRRDTIAGLLTDTASLGHQIATLVRRNGADLAPLLGNLNTVTAVLAKDQEQLSAAVTTLGAFSKNIANATGSGPWLDLLTPVLFEPDNVIVSCGTQPEPGCGR
ncbi:MAG: phospholipid/cholesterol/gamma-HCH transport system substrate-binding protein [Pseudonocardiales bacterium]|jgi:phospholipid/cholesterol/gamma-HCH transport system substrate-binding protein|nr:phospholipid/cholesterol/gamma-HCH transport system substrate-binding protein [Pseudonocardiales bacterium]